ncbi:MAG: type I-C CRISPR-associated protein Cas8c/Csd1 [Desulfuromonas sp.]|nr:type I-C CRISPR-associated protein Cas8c/Csd1 [Desulfuromonas sp.]
MIFQSLIELYDRVAVNKKDEMPPYGFSVEDIGFVITIDTDGNVIGQPEDLRIKLSANSFNFRQSVVPYTNQVNVRSGNAATTPNFMVDKAEYLFGISGKTEKTKYKNSFTSLIAEVCGTSNDDGAIAVKRFLSQWNAEDSLNFDLWKEMCGMHGKWIAFRLQGDRCFIHEREGIKRVWREYLEKDTYPQGVSLIDGTKRPLQLQYAQFKFGTGASVVSFNEDAYKSYGKKKGENAPISVEAEFKSSTALKYLFRSKTQRIRIGDVITLFWAQKESPLEAFMGQVLNPAASDDGAAKSVQKFLLAVKQGILPNDLQGNEDLKFYILGFSLNKSRLALRFWHVSTVGDLLQRLQDHFNNLEMERSKQDIQFPSVRHLLHETVFGKTPIDKDKKISPVLGGALTRSILTGTAYPQSLYQGVIGRIRADGRISYLRASILKAVLMRNYNKEVSMSLDLANREDAYLLGRLFAVLEKAQLDALGNVNSTIKDRFFSSASATPASIFPMLIRLSQHHIAKAEYGNTSDRRISEIIEHINQFPNHMNLQQQGLFAIGYYQQKNALYRKNNSEIEGEK